MYWWISMKIIDVVEPSKIDREPDQIISLIKNGKSTENGFQIQTVEMRSYKQNIDKKLGVFTIITAYVETDNGSIEILYDEGYRGENALKDSVKFLTENLGLSSLILRCTLSLQNKIWKVEIIIISFQTMTKNQNVHYVISRVCFIVTWMICIIALITWLDMMNMKFEILIVAVHEVYHEWFWAQ